MSHKDIIRAWKDPEYRLSLSDAKRAHLPENPAGLIELTDTELNIAAGGIQICPDTYPSCYTFTNCSGWIPVCCIW